MMRRLAEDASHIFLACGATDFRKQISGLVSIVSMQFKLDPFQGTCVFIFCNKKRDSIKVLVYAQNQKKYLETFLEDGRLPISNNLCEATIRPFATARRAWLFADTPKGAKANAILYTLVESARANQLNVFEYLKYLLAEIPNSGYLEHPQILDEYLPWSKSLPEQCRLERTIKSVAK